MTNLLKIQSIQRALVLAIALATITVMSGIGSLGSTATAQTVTTSSTRIVDGSLIRAHNDIDIYIVKIVGSKLFKRLILNPTIFESYGHLRWEDVISVSPATLNNYYTSDLVREVYPDGSIVPPGRVYKLYPQGDTGVKRWVNITQAQFESIFDADSIYGINATEAGPAFYAEGPALTAADLRLGTSTPTTPPAVPTPTTPAVPTTPTVNPDAPVVVTPPSAQDGDEGELAMSDTSRDIEEDLGPGEQGVVLATLLEASGSDIEIRRVDVTFDNTTTTNPGDQRVWKSFDRVRLILDGQVIASRSNLNSDDFVDEDDDGYRLRFSGLEEVIDEDDEVRLEVEVTVDSNLTTRRTDQDWTVSFKEDAIRGVDEAGINLYGNKMASATFEVTDTTGELKLLESSTAMVDDRVRVSTKEGTDGITVLNLDFENPEGAPEATLTELSLRFHAHPSAEWPQTNSVRDFVKNVSVYVGDTEVDSKAITDSDALPTSIILPEFGNLALSNLNVDFDADETRTLTVKIDVGEFAAINELGKITAYVTGFVYEYGSEDEEVEVKVEDTSANFAINNTDTYIQKGDPITFTSQSPVVMEKKSATLTAKGVATFVVDISAPEDNAVYLAYEESGCASNKAFKITTSNDDNTSAFYGIAEGSAVKCSIETDATKEDTVGNGSNPFWVIEAGETETFTITAYPPNAGIAGSLTRIYLHSVTWGTWNGEGTATVVDSTDVIRPGFETPRVYVDTSS